MSATKEIALLMVTTSQVELEQAQDRRRDMFREAREAGCSWVEIGEAAGMTSNGCRLLVGRAEKGTA